LGIGSPLRCRRSQDGVKGGAFLLFEGATNGRIQSLYAKGVVVLQGEEDRVFDGELEGAVRGERRGCGRGLRRGRRRFRGWFISGGKVRRLTRGRSGVPPRIEG
jgi:hypothetical protein